MNEISIRDEEVDFFSNPKECEKYFQQFPDVLELEGVYDYAKEHPEQRSFILSQLSSVSSIFLSAVVAILDNKTVSESYQELFCSVNKNNDFVDNCENAKSDSKKGFVYLANLDNEKGLIKIGKTNNITQRENTFVTGNIHLKIFAYVQCENPYELENYLHKFFKNKQVKNEWFSLTDDDVQLLVELFDFKLAVETKQTAQS